MKLSNRLILSATIISTHFITQCCDVLCPQQLSFSVRQATLNDMNQINALSKQQYLNDFKPMWEDFYVPLFNLKEDVNERIERLTQANEKNNRAAIESQNKQQDSRLLVAEITAPHQRMLFGTHIAGFCRFERKSQKTMYINFIVVNEGLRRRRVAQQLAHSAMRTWPEVEEAQFRALLLGKQEINNLYVRLGATQKEAVSLDPNTGALSTDPDAPKTHYDYSYVIKK